MLDRYRIVIKWPKPYETARHYCSDKTHALSTCEMVKKIGLNGARQVFPIRVWIEETNKIGL